MKWCRLLILLIAGGFCSSNTFAQAIGEISIQDIFSQAVIRSKTIDVGHLHVCALSVKGELKCWGHNNVGQMGIGSQQASWIGYGGKMGAALPKVDLGAGRQVRSIEAGMWNTCALLENGDVKCWGRVGFHYADPNNKYTGTFSGGIGDRPEEMGDNLKKIELGTNRKAIAISLGRGHGCAILENNKVKCWGMNEHLQLGFDKLRTEIFGDIGDQGSDMGDALPYVDLGTGRTAKAISSGYYHTCAILDNSKVKCWGGYGFWHVLGVRVTDPYPKVANTTSSGEQKYKYMGDKLKYVDLGESRTAKAISADGETTCVILDNDQVTCWGANSEGQLGRGDRKSYATYRPEELGDQLRYVDLGAGRIPKQLAVAYDHVCAVLDGDELKCWGENSRGQLGQGNQIIYGGVGGSDPSSPDYTMGDKLPPIDFGVNRKVLEVAAGDMITCALLDQGHIKCFGTGMIGALGYSQYNFCTYNDIPYSVCNENFIDYPNEVNFGNNAATAPINLPSVDLAMDIGLEDIPPVAVPKLYVLEQNHSIDFELRANDLDSEDLSFTIIKEAKNGVRSDDSAFPFVTYTPYQDFLGSDEIKFTASDGTLVSDPVTIDIVVAKNPPDDARIHRQYGLARVNAFKAWEKQTDCSAVIVAVIDTGVDYTHPDLKNNIEVNAGEVPNNGQDDDGNGFVDDYYGFDFSGYSVEKSNRKGTGDSDPMDEHSHGTNIAGIIGAEGNNNLGIVGICHTAKILPVKFMDKFGRGASSDAAEAVHYALLRGAKVLNNSWGLPERSETIAEAVEATKNHGAIFVAAAGNQGLDLNLFPYYPASFNTSNMISVAAVDHNSVRASFSNYAGYHIGHDYNTSPVHIAAPGVSIYGTYPTASYGAKSGTSAASGYVSGAAAMLMTNSPGLTADQVRMKLFLSTTFKSSLIFKVLSAGIIDIDKVLR